jgi:hypothetical protein
MKPAPGRRALWLTETSDMRTQIIALPLIAPAGAHKEQGCHNHDCAQHHEPVFHCNSSIVAQHRRAIHAAA